MTEQDNRPKWIWGVWMDEFSTEWQKLVSAQNPSTGRSDYLPPEEANLLKDIQKCSPVKDYLPTGFIDEFKSSITKKVMPSNEVVQGAKANASMGKKWCIDIIRLGIAWTIANGPGLIEDATINSLYY